MKTILIGVVLLSLIAIVAFGFVYGLNNQAHRHQMVKSITFAQIYRGLSRLQKVLLSLLDLIAIYPLLLAAAVLAALVLVIKQDEIFVPLYQHQEYSLLI